MTNVDVDALDRINRLSWIGGVSTATLDASTEYMYVRWQATKTGNVSKIFCRSTGVTASPAYRVGLQGVSAGLPSGTWLGATANGYGVITPSSAGYHEITLTESVAVTKGEMYFVVIAYDSGTIGASNRTIWAQYVSSSSVNMPTTGSFTGSHASVASWPAIAVGYDDGSYAVNNAPFSNTNQSWSSSSSPKWRGTKFVAPCTFKADRVLLNMRGNAGGDFKILIVKGAASTADHEVTIDVDAIMNAAANRCVFELGTNYQFDEGETYRIFIEPTTTTAINTLNRYDFYNASFRQLVAGIYSFCTATALGTNSDFDAAFVPLQPLVSEIVVPAGSGGGRIGFGSFG